MSNTVRAENGAEVYEHEIKRLADEYISSLNDPDDIKNRITFSGLMRYIYNNFFKPTKDMVIYNNRSSILDYSDIWLLMDIYNIFIDLCTKYKQEYTKNKFLTMTGISDDTIKNWKKGVKIPAHNGMPSDAWVAFAKKLDENSENALSDSMLGGNLMAYAQLKCWYGWTETPQRIEVVGGQIPDQTAADIAARHRIAGQAERPQLPDDL